MHQIGRTKIAINPEMSFQIKHNYLLAMCVAALIAVCFLSINAPIRFKRERDIREAAVKQRLMKIRTAEERYRAATGVYTGDFTVLVRSGCIADSLTFIPYAGGKRFNLAASARITKSGRQIPLVECAAEYTSYLKGLDRNAVAALVQEAVAAGRYPGLKIGDITTSNSNAGNWE